MLLLLSDEDPEGGKALTVSCTGTRLPMRDRTCLLFPVIVA